MQHTGIGLRQPHYAEFFQRAPAPAFVELHSENFFADGGAAPQLLRQLRERWPVCTRYDAVSWLFTPWVIERMTEYLSDCWASSGSSSLMRRPSVLVAMGEVSGPQ